VVHTVAPFIVAIVVLMGYYAYQRGQMSRYVYHCTRCNTSSPLSPLGATLAPNRYGGSKYGRCRNCGEWSWLDPVPRA
jgi:hypothetical protein